MSHVSGIQKRTGVDAAKNASVIRGIVLLVIFSILGLAIFNVVVPKQTLTTSDVESIAKSVDGDTGFPLQEGASLAQQFMEAYYTVGTDDSASEMLSAFYGGTSYASANSGSTADTTGGDSSSNTSISNGYSQVVKYGPYVYYEQGTSSSTATYKVGALTYRKDGDGNVVKTSEGNVQYRWTFYEIDLYYSSKTEKFTVAKDSPTMVAAPSVADADSIPDAQLPGDKNENKSLETSDTEDVITGFFTAWAASDTSALSLVTTSGSTKATQRGLDGIVKMDGDPTIAIYGPPSTDSYYRALVTVDWKDAISSSDSFTQTSTYILKLQKKSGKFYVIDVNPYLYLASDDD